MQSVQSYYEKSLVMLHINTELLFYLLAKKGIATWRVTVDTPILLIAEIISKIHEDLVTFLVVNKWI